MKKLFTSASVVFLLFLMNQPVRAQQYIDFGYYTSGQCVPTILNITNYTTGISGTTGNPLYHWYLNGNFFSDEFNPPPQAIETAGYYNLELKVFDSHDMSIVGVSPIYDFTVYDVITDYNVSTLEACPGEKIFFEVPRDVYSVEWDFGDNALFPDEQRWDYNPGYSYKNAGNYNVRLIVSGPCGTDTIIKTIVVKEDAKPTVKAMVLNTPVCPNDEVVFDVFGDFASYLWDFGDGQTSTLKSPVHTYPDQNAASYWAKVTVTNKCGGSGTDSVEVIIADDIPVYADFDFNPIHGYDYLCPLVEIEFMSSSQGRYLWKFGDGEISTGKNPVHRYSSPGVYEVTLSVVNGCGSKALATKELYIDFIEEDYPGYPHFEVAGKYNDTLMACPGEPLKFINHTWTEKDIIYEWELGDGTIKKQRDITHFYEEPGVYNVMLTIYSLCGGQASTERTIIVDSTFIPEDAMLNTIPLSVCPGDKVYFYDEEYDPDKKYRYDFFFGDEQQQLNITGITNPDLFTLAEHVYQSEGIYTYTAKVTNYCGNSADFTGEIIVNPDLATKSFYYLQNPTVDDDRIPPEDWSKRKSLTDHEFSVTVNWPSWEEMYGNIFHIFIWYGGFYYDEYGEGYEYFDFEGFPDGYVTFSSDSINIGEKVTFYTPISPMDPLSIGLIAAYYCGGDIDPDMSPDAWGTLYAPVGGVINEIPVEPGGMTDLDTISQGGITIDPDYYGLCRKDYPDGMWYRKVEEGVYAIIDIEYDFEFGGEGNWYEMFYSSGLGHHEMRADISSGSFYLYGEGQPYEDIMFQDDSYCRTESNYKISKPERNQILFLPNETDECQARADFLDGTFHKLTDEIIYDRSACPGDPIKFIMAGGSSWLWEFGDGNTSTEQNPVHIYSDTGRYNVRLIVTDGCGRKDTLYTPASVFNRNIPESYIYWNPYNPRTGDTLYFNGAEYSYYDPFDGNTYFWDFGDGNSSDKPRPKHLYSLPGEYEITLTVSNGCGSATMSEKIKVLKSSHECIARFIYSMEGNEVYFQDQSIGEITSWQWNFGDGKRSSDRNPNHQYAADGTYIVTLTIYNAETKCINSQKRIIVVGEPDCEANFSYIINSNTGLTLFTPQVVNADKYYWDFGDGKYSTEEEPQHTFSRLGIYTVCLIVWNDQAGCLAKFCSDIMYGTEETAGVLVDFSYFVDHESKTVNLTDLTPVKEGKWYWTMGDGTIKSSRNPVHTYKKAGHYEVCMSIFHEGSGKSIKICKNITVGDEACGLDVKFSQFTDPVNKTAVFRNESTGVITDWFWSFGDGSTSVRKNPKKEYEKPGLYLVTLSARDSTNGCTDQYSAFIQIGSLDCKADFSYDIDPVDNTVRFRNESLGNTAYYYWDFGDGHFSTDINPVHTYTKPGLFYPSLTVTDAAKLCIDRTVKVIQAGEVDCGAQFDVFVDSSTNTAYFTNRAYGDATHLLWIFGDGTYSTEHNPVHTFSVPGYYSVTLNTYIMESQCMDQHTQRVVISNIGKDCKADFAFRPDPGTGTVAFKDLSVGNVVEYRWDFGNGDTSVLKDPVYTFTKSGYKYVCLNILNNEDIPDMNCKWIAVDVPADRNCNADFIFNVDPGTRNVVFFDKSVGSPNTWEWDFGDESNSDLQNPQNTYSEKGYYGVKLAVKNSLTGCASITYRVLNVGETGTLKAGFTYKADSADKKVSGYPVDFVGASSGDGAKYEWDFGDKKQQKKNDFIVQFVGSNIVRYLYQEPGTYTACLRVTNPLQGTSDIICQTVETLYGIGVEQNLADMFRLGIYPNPFREMTRIEYTLPEPMFVEIAIYDKLGRAIDIPVRNNKDTGKYIIYWNSQNHSPGIYHLRMTTKQGIIIKPLVIAK